LAPPQRPRHRKTRDVPRDAGCCHETARAARAANDEARAGKAFTSAALAVEIAASERQCRAPASAVVDLVRAGEPWQGKTAFSAAYGAVVGLVTSMPLGNLTEAQRASLACSTGVSRTDLDALSSATKLWTDFPSLTQEIAFGLIRRRLPGDADSFFLHPKSVIREELRAAVDDNLVSQTYDTTIDAVLSSQWVPAAATWALLSRTGDVCGLAEVLDAAGVTPPATRQSFAEEYCAHEGTPAAFWGAVASLDAGKKSRVQLALQHWSLTRGHKPLLDHLSQARATYPTLDSLVALTEGEWLGIVNQAGIDAPASIPGADAAAKRANYARVLAFSISNAFPMKTFVERVQQAIGDEDIKSFLNNHSDLMFGRDRLTQFEGDLDAMPEAQSKRLRAFERLYRIVPRYESVTALADAGFLSAHDIVQRGRDRFVLEMTLPLGGQQPARDTFDKASWHAAASNIVFTKFAAATNQVQLSAFPNLLKSFVPVEGSGESNAVPDWPSLFGNPGGCTCKHCASVLSASAHLVDLLQWLDGFPSEVDKSGGAKWSALDVLVGAGDEGPVIQGRRPDLKWLELTCKAGSTPLPYIDLANEILEVGVSGKAGLDWIEAIEPIKTSYEPEDLLAGPEIIHEPSHVGAWKAVNQAVYPFSLPVDLWAEETNAYLRYLGVSRAEVIEALHADSGYDDALAKSRLGVRPLGYELLHGDGTVTSEATLAAWGGIEAAALAPVPAFLKQAGLSFEELEELLATRYVNGAVGGGAHSLAALVLSEPTGCHPEEMTLVGLSSDHLARIHPFLRLCKRTGLSITDTDRAVAAFSANHSDIVIDTAMLQTVTETLALAEKLSLPFTDVLSFYGRLDTHERYARHSPFRRVFLDRMVDSPDMPAFEALLGVVVGTEPVSHYRLSLQRALGISASDFDLLTDADALAATLFLPSIPSFGEVVAAGSATITLTLISRLYAAVTLARTLRLSVRDFLVLRAFAGPSAEPLSRPALAASLTTTAAFCRLVEDFKSGTFTVPEVQYLLRAFSPATVGFAPADAAIEALRSDIEKSIDLLVTETEQSEDVDGGRTAALLRELVPLTDSSIFHAVRDGGGLPGVLGPIAPFFANPANLEAMLLGSTPTLASPTERFSYVAKWLERHVRAQRSIVEKLAATHNLPVATVRHLLVNVLESPAFSGRRAIDDFMPARRADELGSPAVNEAASWQSSTLRLLERHARLVRGTRIADPIPAGPDGVPAENLGELAWVYADLGGTPALHNLPRAQAGAPDTDLADTRARFAALLALLRRVALRDRLAGGPDALRRIVEFREMPEAPDLVSATAFLVEQTGWERGSIDDLAVGFGFATGQALLADEALFRVERAVHVCRRLGLSSVDARLLLDLDLDEPTSMESGGGTALDQVVLARRAAKAKVTQGEWAEVARGVRDPFREKLRDALLGYLVPRYYAGTSEVYAELLIDPEMCPCQLTSRVVQATNSVQVFVQRSLLNLDSEVKLPATAATEWEWRKAYRVWEANRRVFLYPENWIDPALRDDKTPLFKELETRLGQGELTDDAVERALEGYLVGLGQLARLEVMALCNEHDDDEDKTLLATHVVARTRSAPARWFYRKHMPTKGWLAWQPMNLDIEGEGLLLTVQNCRLHLFWPVTTVRPSQNQAAPPQDSEQMVPPTMRLDINLAYSVFANGAFSPRRLSTASPIWVTPGKGELNDTGLTARDLALVLAAPEAGSEGQVATDVVVRRRVFLPGLPGKPPTVIWEYTRAGRFVLDPCGDRWASQSHATELGSYLAAQPEDTYQPNLPTVASLTPEGVKADAENMSGPVRLPRPMADLPDTTSLEIVADRPGRYRIVAGSSFQSPYIRFDRFSFEDDKRTLFVRLERKFASTEWSDGSYIPLGAHASIASYQSGAIGVDGPVQKWSEQQSMKIPHDHFEGHVVIEPFDHPYVCDFARRLAARGLTGLLGWKDDHTDSVQFLEESVVAEYGGSPVPKDAVDFAFGGAFSVYNWELFFHVPVFIAMRLSAEGRHEAAQKWLHFVFDPTGGPNEPSPKRFWRFRPFYENHDLATIQPQLSTLAESSSTAAEIEALVDNSNAAQATVASLEKQIATLAADPFNPHAIARHRILAYQKAVVMQYVDNLLDWGDALFRRESLESMHEALSVYLLAADLLGPRPVTITHQDDPVGKTFETLRTLGLDAFGNAAVSIETIVPSDPPKGWKASSDGPPPPDARLYFCVPNNDQLVGTWDRVADRLFKLRNCMSIDGVVRQLPLFSPPIDPAILVRAVAAGVSLDKVLDSLGAPAPLFRFLRLHGKAVEFASHVAGLGQSLLSAIEKRDGEGLTRLRQTHERAVLDAERDVRKGAIEEATQTLEGLRKQRSVVEKREQFYRTIRERLPEEKDAATKSKQAQDSTLAAGIAEGIGAIAHAFPNLHAVAGFPPAVITETGGTFVGQVASAVARGYGTDASIASMVSGGLQTEAGYIRRRDEWRLQAQLAKRELAQVDKQIAAQEIRIALAERELSNLDLRRSQSRDVEDVLRTKFSNTELYDWMVSEVAAQHYRAYQVAYDMAKKAERAYQLERGDDKAVFIGFGAWDSLKRGLLAGERLLGDLRALDAAYLSRTDREREITKHVSLAELAHTHDNDKPYLVALRDGGQAEVELPEWLFDADYPGHYFRRIKAVSVSVATVRNATDGVQCELTLLDSRFRKVASLDGGYAEGAEDERFQRSMQAIKALSTSTADDDAGLFQLDLRDEKLLPYEGQGAIGTWRIEIPREQNRFPLHRIADVVLHLRYTARDAGAGFRAPALAHAKSANANGTGNPARRVRVISARAEAPEGWARFLAGEMDASKNRLEIPISKAGFLSFFGSSKMQIVRATVSATFSEKYGPPAPNAQDPSPPTLALSLQPPGAQAPMSTGALTFCTGEPSVSVWAPAPLPVLVSDSPAAWVLAIAAHAAPGGICRPNGLLEPDALEDLWFTVTYEVAP